MKVLITLLILVFVSSIASNAQIKNTIKIDAKVLKATAPGGGCDKPQNMVDGDPKTAMGFSWANGGMSCLLDLGDGYVVEKVKITNGSAGKTIFFVDEIGISGFLPANSGIEGKTQTRPRKLLNRIINLNHGVKKQGVTEIPLPAGSVGRYLTLNFRAGGNIGEISEIEVYGYKNKPERHLCWWSTDPYDMVANAQYLTDIGVTDIWIDYVETAFPQTNNNIGFNDLVASNALKELKKRDIRYWLGEHEAFTTMVTSVDDLRNDAMWETTLREMKKVYSKAKELGFNGIVMDAENYSGLYEKYIVPEFTDHFTSWSFKEEWGYGGEYYHRGLQVGKVIKETMGSKYIQLYEARLYADKNDCRQGNYWWLKGINDAGVDIWIATEKSYGAGNREIQYKDLPEHLFYWFIETPDLVEQVMTQYPFAKRVIPGYHPWNTRVKVPCYLPKYFKEQIDNTKVLTESFWMYNEGNPKNGDPRLTLDRDFCKKYGITPEDYFDVLNKTK